MMRGGQFTTRPGWENIYTSMAQPKQDMQDRNRSIVSNQNLV